MREESGDKIYDVAHEVFWISDRKWDCERDEDYEWKVIAWKEKEPPFQPEKSKVEEK